MAWLRIARRPRLLLVALALACVGLLSVSASVKSAPTDAPQMTVSGQTISWPLVDGTITRYVFVRKVPGSADSYYYVTCSSDPCQHTPAQAWGLTVKHSVRTDVSGSRWASPELAITYYQARTAAPVLSVDGQTLRWDRVADVGSYVLATKVPGQSTTYRTISCAGVPCTYTPSAVPGTTVNYGMRTNVAGSTWASEVAVSYTLTEPPPPPPASGLVIGLTGTADWLPMLRAGLDQTHARTVRLEAGRMSTTAAKDAAIATARAEGAQPEVLYTNRSTSPSTIRADALRYGPTSTSSLPLLYVELGNEDSYSYKGATATTARTYGDQAEAVADALIGTGVKLIVQADDALYNSVTNWVANVYATFPNVDDHPGVGGWVIHPYGPSYLARINRLIAQTTAQGAPASFPIFVTEYGLASDNGRCLSDNYGWDRCMTYAEAATTLRGVVNDVRANAPAVVQFFIYHEIDAAPPGASSDREAYFGAIRRDGSPKPGYTGTIAYLADGGA
jgi:hypothetical protein